jgi:hypothetical protein
MQVINILSLTGHSPYNITICDITKSYCYSGATGVVSAPLTIDLPSELVGSLEVLVVVTDSIGCEEIQVHKCGEPSPTPTPTPTPTITPTIPLCNCLSIENPLSVTLNFGYTLCDGTSFYGEIYSATTLFVCGSLPYGDSGLVINVTSNVCINNECPGPTPTPTTTPTPTPTLPAIVGYFQDSCDPSYEFTLSNIPFSFNPLSGVYYIESSGYVGCATYIGSTTSTNVFSFVAMGSQPSINHCQIASFIYPCPTQTPTPTITPTNTVTPTITPTITPTTLPTVSCSGTTSSGGPGISDTYITLSPTGGTITILFYMGTQRDKLEIYHGLPEILGTNKKSTTSNNANNNYGPFDNTYGTEPLNTIPTTVQANTTTQFVGTGVNDRRSQYSADTGNVITTMNYPNPVYGGADYQQVIWWKYTASDYITNPLVTIRVTGQISTGWSFYRLCL